MNLRVFNALQKVAAADPGARERRRAARELKRASRRARRQIRKDVKNGKPIGSAVQDAMGQVNPALTKAGEALHRSVFGQEPETGAAPIKSEHARKVEFSLAEHRADMERMRKELEQSRERMRKAIGW